MEKISPPVRILALVLVLVGVAGMLAMRTMGPSAEPVAVPAPVRTPAKKTPATSPKKAAVAAPAKAAATPAPARPKVTAPKPVNPVIRKTGFPSAVDTALQQHAVVVVSLVVPGARVDELTAAEAQAGAKLGNAGFVALNVLNEGVARSLLAKVSSVQDPSVLVVTRAGKVAVELGGFVDRETVAQAAANASA